MHQKFFKAKCLDTGIDNMKYLMLSMLLDEMLHIEIEALSISVSIKCFHAKVDMKIKYLYKHLLGTWQLKSFAVSPRTVPQRVQGVQLHPQPKDKSKLKSFSFLFCLEYGPFPKNSGLISMSFFRGSLWTCFAFWALSWKPAPPAKNSWRRP